MRVHSLLCCQQGLRIYSSVCRLEMLNFDTALPPTSRVGDQLEPTSTALKEKFVSWTKAPPFPLINFACTLLGCVGRLLSSKERARSGDLSDRFD